MCTRIARPLIKSEQPSSERGRVMNTKMLEFDEETTRRIETLYSSKDVVNQRKEVIGLLGFRPGERVIDIGSGPGFLATEIAQAVGPSGVVLGIDISESMLAYSRAHANRLGLAGRAIFGEGNAEALPVADESFDVAVSTQVYEYVEDVDLALSELYRVLRPGGRTLILDTDWDSLVLHSSDPIRTADILKAWDEHLVDPHLPRTLAARLRRMGFEVQDTRVIPIINTEFGERTYSWGLTELIKGFVPGRNDVSQEDVENLIADLSNLNELGQYFLSINRYVFLASRR